VARLGAEGVVVANADDPGAREVASGAKRVLWFGLGESADVRATRWGFEDGLLSAELSLLGEPASVRVPLAGRHNLGNVLAVATASLVAGVRPPQLAAALASFPGVRRRLEVLGEAGGVTVVDDFAHHPTAVRLTLEAAAQRFPGRRLVVAFEPRSLTAGRAEFLPAYAQAFQGAQVVVLAPVFHRQRLAPDQLLDRQALVARLRGKAVYAVAVEEGEDTLEVVCSLLVPGDVFIAMSSGDFGALPHRVLAALGGKG
jgi:UDP-N-acetylmuramate: L-alanyl-gamma-D-glutamyl-meso-diaminopimelate ligase